jgi:hypothetical protein
MPELCHGLFGQLLADKGFTFAKLYTIKMPITAADLLNDKVLPLFAEKQLPMLRILTDRGIDYCGRAETHDY